MIAALVCLAGCGSNDDERNARVSADRFEAALEAADGAGACDQLTEDTASKLEGSQKKPCEQAILSLELTPSREIVDASVWVTSAQVQLDGDTLFMDETPDGWKINAAGCESRPNAPYECELEG
jgi:hypothetical protein